MIKNNKVRPLKRAVIKEEYIAITGDMVEAVILNQMIYWSQRVSDYDKFIEEEKERRAQETIDCATLPLLCGWIHKSAIELKEEIMSSDSPKTIMRKIDSLVKKGFLDRRNNPDHPYDRIYQYRVNFNAVVNSLEVYGYTLEGYKVEETPEANQCEPPKAPDQQMKSHTDVSKGQNDECKGQFDLWKGQADDCNGQSVHAIPETTTEITPKITSSPSYSPKGGKNVTRMDEDMTGEVSGIINALDLEQLHHKDMINPMRLILSDLLRTGKVGLKRFQRGDVEEAIRQLSSSDVDTVIDRYNRQREKTSISCPEDYIKTCLLSVARAAQIEKAAGKSDGEGIYCGNPSYDIEDFVAVQMQLLHEEGE